MIARTWRGAVRQTDADAYSDPALGRVDLPDRRG